MVMSPRPHPARVAAAAAFVGCFSLVSLAGQVPVPGWDGPPPDGISRPQAAREPGTPAGPPPNLKSGVFQPVVEAMWRQSPTFRRQCQRLAAERTLVVTLAVAPSQRPAFSRAWTEMSRKDGTLRFARVIILSPNDTVELIAHEIEHVIEQLDGVAHGDRSSTSSTHAAGAGVRDGPGRRDRTPGRGRGPDEPGTHRDEDSPARATGRCAGSGVGQRQR